MCFFIIQSSFSQTVILLSHPISFTTYLEFTGMIPEIGQIFHAKILTKWVQSQVLLWKDSYNPSFCSNCLLMLNSNLSSSWKLRQFAQPHTEPFLYIFPIPCTWGPVLGRKPWLPFSCYIIFGLYLLLLPSALRPFYTLIFQHTCWSVAKPTWWPSLSQCRKERQTKARQNERVE